MIVKLYPENPNQRTVDLITSHLQADGVIIYPTDSVYAFGCMLTSPKAVEKMSSIRGKDPHNLTIMCSEIAQISEYARFDNTVFKLLKRNLPGPFTFILKASSRVPDKALGKRKTIGIRMADNAIARTIVQAIGAPLITMSVKGEDDILEYLTDPELIHEQWGDTVDLVVDGGYGTLTPTTVVDLSEEDQPEIIREGAGELLM